MALVLSHLVPLRLVGGVGGRIGRTVGREGGIYRDRAVRLHVGGGRGTARGQERTCCLSHAGRRATWLGVGNVGGRAREVVLVGGRTSRLRGVQPVVRLRSVGGRNIGGSSLGLGGVLGIGGGVGAHLWLRGV